MLQEERCKDMPLNGTRGLCEIINSDGKDRIWSSRVQKGVISQTDVELCRRASLSLKQ